MTAKSEKASPLIDYLEERLVSGQYRPGNKLPSLRSLTNRFGISYGTAMRGIDYLCSQGRLEKIPSRGIFVRQRTTSPHTTAARMITVFIEPWLQETHSGMFQTAFIGMQQMAMHCGYSFTVHPLKMEDACEDSIRALSAGAEAVILLNEYDLVMRELNLNIPVVGVMVDHSFGGRISTVNLDPYSSAEQVVNFFRSRNIEQVTIISSPKPVFMTRGRIFAMLWRELGLECEFIADREELEYRRDRGYFFTSDQRAHEYMQVYQQRTGHLPTRKYAVIGMDGKQLVDPSFTRFPTVATDWRMVGEIAFAECVGRIDGSIPVPRSITVYGNLIIPEI